MVPLHLSSEGDLGAFGRLSSLEKVLRLLVKTWKIQLSQASGIHNKDRDTTKTKWSCQIDLKEIISIRVPEFAQTSPVPSFAGSFNVFQLRREVVFPPKIFS